MPLGRPLSRARLVIVLLLLLLAAVVAAAVLTPPAGAQEGWRVWRPDDARRTGIFRHPRLTESSGLAVSRRQPGVLWTLNDSGNPPEVFATDTMGNDLGVFKVPGTRNVDWEAIALGPCGPDECLYIADTGDNDQTRRSVRLYRVPEPQLPAPGRTRSTARAQALELTYPDGPRDVEAALVTGDGTVVLVSKGRGHGVSAYGVPASAWRRKSTVAEELDRLPIPRRPGIGGMVTGAALAPDGRVAIRTYLEIFLFQLTARSHLRPLGIACNVAGLELQGEGIAWLDDGRVVLASEGGFGGRGTLTVARCPLEQT